MRAQQEKGPDDRLKSGRLAKAPMLCPRKQGQSSSLVYFGMGRVSMTASMSRAIVLRSTACALSLKSLFLTRFSLLPFPLLDDPQPRETSGEDHHDDQDGVLYHWSALS